jgi:hypothetical protein
MCVLGILNCSLSTIYLLDFGAVPTVWKFFFSCYCIGQEMIKIAYSPENVVVTCLTRFLVFDPVPSVRIPGVCQRHRENKFTNSKRMIQVVGFMAIFILSDRQRY